MSAIVFASLLLAAVPAQETASPITVTGSLPATPAPTKPKLICRSSPVTGSLVATVRRCGTAAEWAAGFENQRNAGMQLISSHASGIGTN